MENLEIENSNVDEIMQNKKLLKLLMKRLENETKPVKTPKKRGRKPLGISEEEKAVMNKERQKQYRLKYKAERELWRDQSCNKQKKLISLLQKEVVSDHIIEQVLEVIRKDIDSNRDEEIAFEISDDENVDNVLNDGGEK